MAMRRKTRNGTGSVYQTKAGQWKVALTVRQVAGKSKKITRNAASRRHGELLLAELRDQYRDLTLHPEITTVATLVARWLSDFEADQSTLDHYRLLLTQHITPIIGARMITRFTALDAQAWVASAREAGSGARTVQMATSLLRRSFAWAVASQILPHNPFSAIRKPPAPRGDIYPFAPAEVQAILNHTKETRYYAMYLLAFTTGMRQGELFGLQWQDVSFNDKTITIARQARDYRGHVILKVPKTAAGRRRITVTQHVLDSLSSVRAEAEPSMEDQVFPSPRGALMRRTTFGRRQWKPLLQSLGIRHRGAHHMRHTAATQMLTAGVPPHVVAGVLGHSSTATLLKTYAHFLPSDSALAANAMSHLQAE